MNKSGIIPPSPTPPSAERKAKGEHSTPQGQIHTYVLVLGNSIEPTDQAPIEHFKKTDSAHCYCSIVTSAMCSSKRKEGKKRGGA